MFAFNISVIKLTYCKKDVKIQIVALLNEPSHNLPESEENQTLGQLETSVQLPSESRTWTLITLNIFDNV